MIKYLGKLEDFENEIKDELVIVDFYADWCGPCQMLAPVLEELDTNISVKVLKINTDDYPEIARKYRVMSIPTLLLFKNGELTKKEIGYMPLEKLIEFSK